MGFCKRHLHITTRHSKLSAKQAIIQHLLTRPKEASIHVSYEPRNFSLFLVLQQLGNLQILSAQDLEAIKVYCKVQP